MFDLFAEFVDSPSRQNFLALRRALVRHESYQPYANPFAPLQERLDAGDWAGMLEAMPATMPGLLLSPRLHMMAASAHEELGNAEGAGMERFLAERCLEGIRLTGDGSADRPFLVMRVSDEYDVLMTMQKQLAQQSLVQHGDRSFDRMQCTDGSEVWFDVTDLQRHGSADWSSDPPDGNPGGNNGPDGNGAAR